jgi:HNH endonuclease
MTDNIRWLASLSFPDYEVSEHGQVRRAKPGQGARVGAIVRWHYCNSTGYPDVRLRRNGCSVTMNVHRLVSEAFIGVKPTGLVVRHLDGNKLNNSAANLAYGTVAENNADKVRHGTSSAGERNPRAKISATAAAQIRAQHANGVTAKSLATEYGLSASTVHRIVAGRYWAEGRATQ